MNFLGIWILYKKTFLFLFNIRLIKISYKKACKVIKKLKIISNQENCSPYFKMEGKNNNNGFSVVQFGITHFSSTDLTDSNLRSQLICRPPIKLQPCKLQCSVLTKFFLGQGIQIRGRRKLISSILHLGKFHFKRN